MHDHKHSVLYLAGASCMYGTRLKSRRDVAAEEGVLTAKSTRNSTVAVFTNGSKQKGLFALGSAISATCKKTGIKQADVDYAYFSCTLPLTHGPLGTSISDEMFDCSIKQPCTVTVGGHQCSGILACFRHAAARMRCNPSVRAAIIATMDCSNFSSRRTLENGLVQGDAASAILLSRNVGEFEYIGSQLVFDISSYEMASSRANNEWKYFFAIRNLVNQTLWKYGLRISDIEFVIPHISSRKAWERIVEMIKFKKTLMLADKMDVLGHLYGSDIILGLQDPVFREARPNAYVLGLTYGFGATWGAVLLKKIGSSHETVGDAKHGKTQKRLYGRF